MLDEQFNADAARDRRGAATASPTPQRRLDAAAARTDELRVELADRAAALYVGAANGTPAEMIDAADVSELGSRSKYGSAAADEDQRSIDELAVAKEQLAGARTEFEKSRAKAEAKKAEPRGDPGRAPAPRRTSRKPCSRRTKGEIAQLVAADRGADASAEEERRARAEFERRRREKAAKQAAAAAAPPAAAQSSAVAARASSRRRRGAGPERRRGCRGQHRDGADRQAVQVRRRRARTRSTAPA